MTTARKPFSPKKARLDDIVDFGPEESVGTAIPSSSSDVNARLQRLLDQIKSISRRIDDLNSKE